MQRHLATRFARNTQVLRAESPLNEDQMRSVAPSIFALQPHQSRSERYAYIPTIDVVQAMGREGFAPFMVAQGRCRTEGKAEYTKHMIRFRHAAQISTRDSANEVILINSHDGASSYQLISGAFRFVCHNGLVAGDVMHDQRIKHQGNIREDVIEGAFRVVESFEAVNGSIDEMKSLTLSLGEQNALASAALALRFPSPEGVEVPAPVTAAQINEPRRYADRSPDLWTSFQRIQENCTKGGLPGRAATGRQMRTRAITGIDGNVTINRALWVLAEEMRKLKAA